jgi:alpha-beta hydrolase superfamily lysophospholipase
VNPPNVRNWLPRSGKARASVAIVHGFGEYGGLYSEVAEFLAAHRSSVVCRDLRGHGLSPGRRGNIQGWSDYREDVADMVGRLRRAAPELPVFLLGNSMGGLIAADYAIHHSDELSGLILLAPAVGEIGVPAFLLRLSRLLSSIWPTFTMKSGIERSRLTRDPAAIARLDADPLVHSLGTARLGSEMQDAIARVKQQAPELTLPVLVLQGEADQVTSPDSTREFFENIGASDKTLKTYPGALHNLIIDLVKDDVMRDMDTWIARRSPGKTSLPPAPE